MHFYARIISGGAIELLTEEMPTKKLADYAAFQQWFAQFDEKPRIIWGAGFGAEPGADIVRKLPVVGRNASKTVLKNAVGMWEYAANHPESTEWATTTYVKLKIASL